MKEYEMGEAYSTIMNKEGFDAKVGRSEIKSNTWI
jgi:hypothetical protein